LPLDAGERNAFFGLSTNITSILNFLNQNGDARMLAEPKLTCRSGGTAEFLAGGEVPIPITDADGAINVSFKQYGIILKMSPVSDAEGYISTKVTVEVSNIDPTVSVLGIPGFLSRKTETDMNVREGQTMVISGLFTSDVSKSVNKVPGFGHIPVLGELFKSRDFQNKETDLVVFVTPTLIDPEHKTNRAMLKKAQEVRTQSDASLRFELMD
jgi:pilus assembly protein CpaC